jgi:trans-aconitate 2-methyltransferase
VARTARLVRSVALAEYQELLNQAYPTRPYGTVLPFRRIFVVAHRGMI